MLNLLDARREPIRLAAKAAAILAFATAPEAWAQTADASRTDVFEARVLVALSDADMVPSAYVDGKLGPAAGLDAMTVIGFDRTHVSPASTTTLPVSNSVAGPPAPMAITPDGRYAIVVATLGPRPSSGEDVGLAMLAKSRTITVVDLTDPARPKVVQRLAGPRNAATISISADGKLAAVGVGTDGDGVDTPLWMFHFENGRLEGGKDVDVPGWRKGDDLVAATFAPSGEHLALLNQSQNTLSLFEVRTVGASVMLVAWGEPVPVERFPFAAKFSPDGRYVIVNAYYAGGPGLVSPNMYPAGTVSAIRLAAQGDDRHPIHIVTAHEQVGRGPEGLAVSPTGEFIVSVNMEGSYFPSADKRRTRYSSLTLLRLDEATGSLERAGQYAFDGLLPESAVFDKTGTRLAVANFGDIDDPTAGGRIDFWRLERDPQDRRRVQLVQTHHSIPVIRGCMELAIADPR